CAISEWKSEKHYSIAIEAQTYEHRTIVMFKELFNLRRDAFHDSVANKAYSRIKTGDHLPYTYNSIDSSIGKFFLAEYSVDKFKQKVTQHKAEIDEIMKLHYTIQSINAKEVPKRTEIIYASFAAEYISAINAIALFDSYKQFALIDTTKNYIPQLDSAVNDVIKIIYYSDLNSLVQFKLSF